MNRAKIASEVWLLGVGLTISICCTRSSFADEPAVSTSANASNTRKQAELRDDRSLTDAELIRLGMPADDRAWSGDDMVRAARVLADVAKRDPKLLPRYKSAHSGATFARLTSTENLGFFRNRALPLGVRLPQGMAYMESTSQIFKIYTTPRR
jgi:hypothetical protein